MGEKTLVARLVADQRTVRARALTGFRIDVGSVLRVVLCDDRVVETRATGVFETAAGITGDIAGDRNVDQSRDAAVLVKKTAADSVFFRNRIANDRRVDNVQPTVVLSAIRIFAALVINTAAGLVRRVARDNRVSDRQPTEVVINTAAVVRLSNLPVRFALFFRGVCGCGENLSSLRVRFITRFADEAREIGRGDGNVILTDRAVIRISVAGRIAESGSFNAQVVRVANV